MHTNKPKFIRFCTEHKEEPILRVSLDVTSPKLFYCYDCLADLSEEAQSKLVKFSEFIDKIHEQIPEPEPQSSEGSSINDLISFASDKESKLVKLDTFISQQKQRVDEEFNFLENELRGLVRASKNNAQKNFETLEQDFGQKLADYFEKVDYASNIRSANQGSITQEDLQKELLIDDNVEEIEKRVRKQLEKSETINEIKSGKVGQVLDEKKRTLEDLFTSSDLVMKKQASYYKQKLEVLSGFFEALIFVNDSTESESRKKLEKVKESLNEFNKKIKERTDDVNDKLRSLFKLPNPQECSFMRTKGETEGDLYICETCVGPEDEISDTDEPLVGVCEECKDTCHQGHKLVKKPRTTFKCSCQFVTTQCKFATTCTFKYTGTKRGFMRIFKCKTDNMDSEEPLCHFCATVCHKGHQIKEKGIADSAYCFCSQNFDFCKLKQENH